MNFLANENFPFPSIKILRSENYSVKSISENNRGISDEEIIEIAQKDDLIILTFDKDYGEIIFKFKPVNPPSVIFFRYKGSNPEFAGKLVIDLIKNKKIEFSNNFTVVEENGIRQRKY